MCNQTTVPSVTLQTAVLMTVKEFAEKGTKFSAHDLTRSLRDKCNTGQMEIPEVEDLSGADSFRFKVDHAKVRILFNEMRDNGVFDADFSIQREFNGMYYDYFAASVSSVSTLSLPTYLGSTTQTPSIAIPPPVANPPVANPPVSTPPPYTPSVEIKRRVEVYLDNLKGCNFCPNLKNVQSAIKRGNRSTGVSKDELANLIRTLGYKVFLGPTGMQVKV